MNIRTISLKLQPTPWQGRALSELADKFAKACSAIVPFVQSHNCWNRVALHHLVYYYIREEFPELGSQMVCQAIHRVADAYKTLKANSGIIKGEPVPGIVFDASSVNFDKRTYSMKDSSFSLFTIMQRENVTFIGGQHQLDLLAKGVPKEARLVRRNKTWYFNLYIELSEAAPIVSDRVLGVDIGENNLAATSSGKLFGGGKLRDKRDRYLAHRRRLQSNGSRAAKKRLREISGREQRHVKHVNHVISKAVVTEALRINAGEIRMEDLINIRANIKAGKRVRTRLHRWAFRQLQGFVDYKAKDVGMGVKYRNPAYTSQTCSVCGAIGKRERSLFSCSCGTRRHADVNASVNIAEFPELISSGRGVVNRPKFAHGSVRPL